MCLPLSGATNWWQSVALARQALEQPVRVRPLAGVDLCEPPVAELGEATASLQTGWQLSAGLHRVSSSPAFQISESGGPPPGLRGASLIGSHKYRRSDKNFLPFTVWAKRSPWMS